MGSGVQMKELIYRVRWNDPEIYGHMVGNVPFSDLDLAKCLADEKSGIVLDILSHKGDSMSSSIVYTSSGWFCR